MRQRQPERLDSRLEVARRLGAEAINFETEHPVETIKSLTGGIGVDRCIDAVGVDAEAPEHGPAAKEAKARKKEFGYEVSKIAKAGTNPDGDLWRPGSGPSQALRWEVESLCKAGTLSIIGVYPETDMVFPIGQAMMKNLAVNMGNCHHRKYVPRLIDMVRSGRVTPTTVLTQQESLVDAITAYEEFDRRRAGWVKVELTPTAAARPKTDGRTATAEATARAATAEAGPRRAK